MHWSKRLKKNIPFFRRATTGKAVASCLPSRRWNLSAKNIWRTCYWAGYSTIGPMLKEKSMLARYISPEAAAVAGEYKDKEGYWVATRISMAILAYHAKKVPAGKVPKNYYELLDPFWKGTISIDSSPARFTHLLAEKYGWEKMEGFHKKFAEQNPKIHRGRTARMQLILAGESLAGLDINADNIIGMQKEGAPLDFAVMDPTLLSLTSVALPQNPAHLHAAALFYDFIVSKEGQTELAAENNLPIRDDVEIKSKELARRYSEGRTQKKFIVQAPNMYDAAMEEKYDRLYIQTLLKKSK